MLYANISCHYWFCCWLVSANEKSFLYFKDNIFLLLKLLSLLLTYRWGMKLEWTRVLRFFCQASLSGFSLELCWAHPLPTATKLILLLQILFFLMVHRDLSFLLNPEFLQGRDEGSICLFHVPYIILDRTEGFERSAAAAAAKSLQSCLTLSNPMDCSLPGSSVHGIFQARVLEWGAIAFSVWMFYSVFTGGSIHAVWNVVLPCCLVLISDSSFSTLSVFW